MARVNCCQGLESRHADRFRFAGRPTRDPRLTTFAPLLAEIRTAGDDEPCRDRPGKRRQRGAARGARGFGRGPVASGQSSSTEQFMYFFLSRAFTRSVLCVMFLFGLIAMIANARAQGVDAVGLTNSDTSVPKPIAFSPCAEDQSLECGMLIVPVDYQDPNGTTFQIAVIRARATKPAQRIGVMVANPGGPGFS